MFYICFKNIEASLGYISKFSNVELKWNIRILDRIYI